MSRETSLYPKDTYLSQRWSGEVLFHKAKFRLNLYVGSYNRNGNCKRLTEYFAKGLGRCHRKSTMWQDQSVWVKFLKLLEDSKMEHWNVKGRVIVNFLSFYAKREEPIRRQLCTRTLFGFLYCLS